MADQSIEFEIKTKADAAELKALRKELDTLLARIPGGGLFSRLGRAGSAGLGAVAVAGAAASAALATMATGLREVAERQDAMARLKGFGFAGDSADLQTVKDLAKALGTDLAGATETYIRAANGNIRSLKALGFNLSENATYTERLAEIQNQAAIRGAKIQAEAAGTITGKQKALGKAFKDAAESIAESTGLVRAYGEALDLVRWMTFGEQEAKLAPALKPGNDALKKRLEYLEQLRAEGEETAKTEAMVAEALKKSVLLDIDRAEARGRITPEQAKTQKAQVEASFGLRGAQSSKRDADEAVSNARGVFDALNRDRARFSRELATQAPGSAGAVTNQKRIDELDPLIAKARAELTAAVRAQQGAGLGVGLATKEKGLADFNNMSAEEKQRSLKPALREQNERTFRSAIDSGQDRNGQIAKFLAAYEEQNRKELEYWRRLEGAARTARTP